jgi:hypothetical protein
VFEKKNVNTLSKHWPCNYTINFEEGVQFPFIPIYNLSQNELVTLHEYINKNLEKGFIWHSKSPTGAPIFFVKKHFFYECVSIIVDWIDSPSKIDTPSFQSCWTN